MRISKITEHQLTEVPLVLITLSEKEAHKLWELAMYHMGKGALPNGLSNGLSDEAKELVLKLRTLDNV